MPSPFAALSAFAQTRNGKLAVGGSAVGGVVVLALVRRKKASGSAADAATAGSAAATPSYLQTTGTSGANVGAAPVDNSSGGGATIDPGQLQDLITGLGNQTDALNQVLGQQAPDTQPQATPPPTPAPPPPAVLNAPTPTYNPPPAPPAPPISQSPAPVPALAGNMRRGSKGGQVSQLQSRLVAIGYPLAVDGDFGPQTQASVQDFQNKRHLAVDGVVGPATWASLWHYPGP